MLPAIVQFGGFFAVRGDYITQHITRTITARRMLWNGSLPLWDWTSFLGTEYSYWRIFLSFDCICMLVPESFIPYMLTFTNLLRFFVMGFAACLLIGRFVNKSESAMLGGLLYAFSSYVIVTFEFMLFLDAAALFPLLLLALEKRFTDEKYRFLLILAVVLNGLAWAYLFIGTSLAMLVYALVRFFTAEEWRPRRKVKCILLCFAEYFIGVLICGLFFAIFVKSMFSTSRAVTTMQQQIYLKHLLIPKNLFNVFAGVFLPGASNRVTTFFSYTNWYSMNAYVPVFGFSLCAASLARHKRKDGFNLILVCYLVVSVFPILNGISSFYANEYTRWWYALALIMALISARTIDDLNGFAKRQINAGIAVQWAAIIIIPAIFYGVYLVRDNEFEPLKSIIAIFFKHNYGWGRAEDLFRLYSVVFALLSALAAWLIVKNEGVLKKAVPIVCVFAVLYGASFVMLNNSASPKFVGLYGQGSTPLTTMVHKYYSDDKPVNSEAYCYRADYPSVLLNYAVVINRPSISSHESTFDTDAVRFAVFAGMGNSDSVFFTPRDDGNALRTLLSVKYYYNYIPEDPDVTIPQGFVYSKTVKGVDVYENTNYIPFGFAYDSYITETELDSLPQADVGLMLHTLVISDEDVPIVQGLLMHCSDLTAELEADVSARAACSSESFAADTEGFDAEFSLDCKRLVFFSVPYDEGWRAFVDGEETGFIKANLGFMAIVIPEGQHTVQFRYHNPAIVPGLALSCIGVVLCAVYVIVSLEKEKRNSA